jgi:iron complex transport system substrate-binding protein
MKIVSLVPHATELLFALGLGDDVVGVTHECDFPPAAGAKRRVTADRLPPGLSAGAIDAAVRERTQAGEAIYALDEDALKALDPDLIVTQELCPVCAVSYDQVVKVAERIPACPAVLSLDPHTLGETLADVRTVAERTEREDEGEDLVDAIGDRLDAVRRAVDGAPRPRVACIEWFDPVFLGGHWVPEMVELAGGEDVLGLSGERSEVVDWETLAAARPEVVVCLPCGYDAQRSAEEARRFAGELRALGARRVVAVDASGLFSRPGPRLVEGVEVLAHVLHPDRVPDAPSEVVDVYEAWAAST